MSLSIQHHLGGALTVRHHYGLSEAQPHPWDHELLVTRIPVSLLASPEPSEICRRRFAARFEMGGRKANTIKHPHFVPSPVIGAFDLFSLLSLQETHMS